MSEYSQENNLNRNDHKPRQSFLYGLGLFAIWTAAAVILRSFFPFTSLIYLSAVYILILVLILFLGRFASAGPWLKKFQRVIFPFW